MTVRVGDFCPECMHLTSSSTWGHCPSCGCPNHDSSAPARPLGQSSGREAAGRVRSLLARSRPPSDLSPSVRRDRADSLVALFAIGALCAGFVWVVTSW